MSHADLPEPALALPPDAEQQDGRLKSLRQQLKRHGLALLAQHSYWLPSTPSTNQLAKTLALPCALVISNQQTAGRGQAGRAWHSPEGNLYLSLLWTLQHPLSGRLALEVALSLLNMPCLRQQAGLVIKWPNDLYFNQAKWGGILIEPVVTRFQPDSLMQGAGISSITAQQSQVVIGVGLNLASMQQHVPDQAVTDLGTILGCLPDRITLLLQTTQALIEACQQFDHGSIDLPTRFAVFDALLQQQVRLQVAGQADVVGTMRGIAPDGALLLETASHTQVVYSGQVRPVLA